MALRRPILQRSYGQTKYCGCILYILSAYRDWHNSLFKPFIYSINFMPCKHFQVNILDLYKTPTFNTFEH